MCFLVYNKDFDKIQKHGKHSVSTQLIYREAMFIVFNFLGILKNAVVTHGFFGLIASIEIKSVELKYLIM